jgi:DNA-binding CsgD family transcriptional regulator
MVVATLPREIQLATACLDFLEAVYSWNEPDARWLGRAVTAAWELWGRPRWAIGLVYDASDVHNFRYSDLVFTGADEETQAVCRGMLAGLPSEFIAESYRTLCVGFGKQVTGGAEEGWKDLARVGINDLFGINGLDPSGIGCFVGVATARSAATAEQVALSQRLAAHLAAGYRCRRALRGATADPLAQAEAILEPDGRLLEARGAAQAADARKQIQSAAHAMEDVRTDATGKAPTQCWRPRVRARWTLVETRSDSGQRYVIARENQLHTDGLDMLTEREQQVVIAAALGKTNKEIAYELGISDSTTRVLLARACGRLGVRSRQQLFDLPQLRALRGEDPGG